ncbi:hypothetical protein L1D46_05270 [Pseudoalteromonas sp. Isolate3]|uniref:hypothetical protein n=1 Tax=Pseudoalteromonas sp. Isolate3 TaxID=2908526 RepID=UPI001EFEA736|nr:hypothetical protein [Pseudoalteromonas sp. Isolate3]MCG9708210.1 hypothetical protein [Pseudoalteromonas sp. Isolate3]
MTASAGAWYRVGTVNVTNGQQSIVGVNTAWQNDVISIAVGDIFTLDAKTWYEVTAVNSDTSLTLDRGFEGATQNTANYAIVRNTSGTLLTRIAGQIAVQFNQKQLFLDELRTWLNSDNAAEGLTDSHGVKTQLKTPAQMVRDHDEKLAELDSIHPHPWAMRKVEFEAMRAAGREKYASGFYHKGKEYTNGVNRLVVASGLWTNTTFPNILNLGRDSADASQQGDSKQSEPVICIDGVLTELSGLSTTNGRNNLVKLPPAEGGTRTYNSATGKSVTYPTPALAFAAETTTNKVVTDRVDMWGFEAFLREITDDDPFVYKKGLIQSLASDINGVATVSDNVRPITYFAWYAGDTTSRGKGVNWQTATEEERIAIASDLGNENKIYFDDATGKFYQWCVRGRSIAGAGNGDWDWIDASSSTLNYGLQYQSAGVRVKPQGINSFIEKSLALYTEDLQSDYLNYNTDIGLAKDFKKGRGIFAVRVGGAQKPSDFAVNGQCYFLVCNTVQRLNKGGYHPSFNPLGTKGFSNQDGTLMVTWAAKASIRSAPLTKADCFDYPTTDYPYTDGKVFGGVNSVSGTISGGPTRNSRPDGRYFDAIYESGQGGVCRDMRYSAHKLTAEDFAEEDLRIKAGEYRGREKLFFTKKVLKEVSTSDNALAAGTQVSNTDNYTVGDLITVYSESGETLINEALILSKTETGIIWDGTKQFERVNGGTYILVTGYYTNISVADEFIHTEVIGDPANIILCDDLKDGWVGSWNPTIPDGISQTYTLTKPQSGTPSGTGFSAVVTTDSGQTLTSTHGGNLGWNSITNSATFSTSASAVIVANYFTKARVTQSVVRDEILGGCKGVGMVYASSYYLDSRGRGFGFSLTGKLNTNTLYVVEAGQQHSSFLTLSETPILDNKLNSGLVPTHRDLTLGTPSNNSPAFKALNYNVVKNQQGFINYAYAQLTYDATAGDWGDDGKIHIADNQTTMLDENGHTNLVGMACCVEPIGWV